MVSEASTRSRRKAIRWRTNSRRRQRRHLSHSRCSDAVVRLRVRSCRPFEKRPVSRARLEQVEAPPDGLLEVRTNLPIELDRRTQDPCHDDGDVILGWRQPSQQHYEQGECANDKERGRDRSDVHGDLPKVVTGYVSVGGNRTLATPGCQPVKYVLMVNRIAVSELPIVGGNLALDFANTQSGPPGGEPDVESLAGYEDLVAWALRIGVVGPPDADDLVRRARRHPRDATAAFERATALRDRIFTIFESIANNTPPQAEALERLRDDEAEAVAHADLATGPGGFAWTWSRRGDLDGLRWPIVHAAATLLTTGPLGRVKACGGCRDLFLDETKNGSRRWCSMAECGTRAKMRRFVARRSAARSRAT
jgi:predicted RNA-binding Zn ribbon-like protein